MHFRGPFFPVGRDILWAQLFDLAEVGLAHFLLSPKRALIFHVDLIGPEEWPSL